MTYNSGEFIYYYDNGQQLGRLRAILKNANDEQYRLKIQKIVNYDNLPGNFKGMSRRERSVSGEVWLQDEPFQIITIFEVLEKTSVMITYQHQHIPKNALKITEIIYKY